MMPTPHRERCKEIFDRARKLSPEERGAFLESACGSDVALRAQVAQLLTDLDAAGNLLAEPTLAPPATAPSEWVGSAVGAYKLLELIGEGGFGEVWTAEQREPVRRRVALKIIKAGMDSKEVLARFEVERQALALMDHPNVAKVFDAGITDEQSSIGAGRSYFVMEHAAGLPITDYCDSARLRIRQRLELFVLICQAVQHAHSKGIIHRDLKPSNMLVTLVDGRPVPKVIDFGIAKATATPLTDRTLHTQAGRLMGTPEYMSPEQAGTSGIDVDTRSDVYSLGVILYQLLTGTLPFEPHTLRKADHSSLVKIIREMEPPTPSSRLSTLGTEPVNQRGGATPQEIAVRRDTEFAALQRQVKGELDWIVMKCLEKDRARRYETANGLAADVQHFLSGEPVVAAPPSRVYRLRKFVRRNRAMVTAATMVVAALLAGTAGTTFGLLRAEQRRAEAEAAREQTQQVSDFQAAMLSEIDVEAMGRGIKEHLREDVRAALERQYVGEFPNRRERTPEEVEAELAAFDQRADAAQAVDVARRVMDEFVLSRAADALEEQFAEQPLVRAQLHHSIGTTYRELGLYDAAEPHLRVAMETLRRVLGDDHPDTLNSIISMGRILRLQGRLPEAEPYCREALETSRRVLGDEHQNTLRSIHNMGLLLQEQGKLPEAEAYHREALETSRRVYGDDQFRTLIYIHSFGLFLQAEGRPSAAEPYYREALEGYRRVRGNTDRYTLNAIDSVGYALKAQRKLAEAEPYYREALEGRRRVLGDDHHETLVSVNNLGQLLLAQGRLAEAERYHREALEGYRRVLGDDHPHTLISINNLGRLLQRRGKLPDAETYLQEAVERCRRVLGIEHSTTLSSINNLGRVLMAQDKLTEAEPLISEALETKRRVLGDEHPNTLSAITSMGRLFQAQGKLTEAELCYREVYETTRRKLGNEHPSTLKAIHNIGSFLQAQGRLSGAQSLFAEGTRAARAGLGDHQITAIIEHHYGDVLREVGRLDEALDLAQTAVDRYRAHPGWPPGEAACARTVLAGALRAAGRPTDALAVKWESVQAKRQRPGTTPGALASALAGYAAEAIAIGDTASLESAEGALRECLEIREAVLPDDHPRVWLRYNSMSMLGEVLVEQATDASLAVEARMEKLREAEPLLVESGEWLTQNADHIPQQYRAERLRQALERLVKLYESWDTVAPDSGKADQAAEWRAELENLPGP